MSEARRQPTAEPPPDAWRLCHEFLFHTSAHLLEPINVLLGGCDDLLAETLPGDLAWRLRTIQDRGQEVRMLVNDLRDYAESCTGRMVIEPVPVDLSGLLEEVAQIAAWLLKSKPQIELRKNIPPKLPFVSGSYLRIERVLMRLVHNASKFTETGYILIAATLENNQAVLHVEDSGRGISPEDQPLVFEPFLLAAKYSDSPHHGLGVGLATCRYIVEAHGGRLWFESQPGRGSAFHFSLPLVSPS